MAAAAPTADGDRARALELLGRFANNPAPFLVRYEAPWRFYFGRDVDGAVPYLGGGSHVVVGWSDPLCAPEHARRLTKEFLDAMRRGRRNRTCLVLLSEQAALTAGARGCTVVKIGEEPVIDLTTWRPPRGNAGKGVRWCCNHARAAGVEVGEYRPAEGRNAALERELGEAQESWERSLERPLVRSILRPAPLEAAEEKRIFYARGPDGLAAILGCAPVSSRGGWFLEDLLRMPQAPNGATELLVVETLARLAAAGAPEAALGLVPLRGFGGQPAAGQPRWLQLVARAASRRYRPAVDERRAEQLAPSRWEPRYVAFPARRPSVRLALGVAAALGL